MTVEFFGAIWPETEVLFGELRAIRSGEVFQTWVPLGEHRGEEAFAESLRLSDAGWDVYFGVVPRLSRGGTATDCTLLTNVLWADVDAKQHHADLKTGKALALAAVAKLPITPSILVDSGGGLHAYWLLDRYVSHADIAAPVMQGIARATKGDHTHDLPRVLRVPGTINRKREQLAPARLLRFDGLREYRPADFNEFLLPATPAREPGHVFPRLAELPSWLLQLIEDGAPKGQRSEAGFKAILWLLRYGRDEEEIRDIFWAYEDGIGAKVSEMAPVSGARWLSRSISKARERA